ncbi:MAG: hypothetical protein ACJAZ3_000921 [Sphingobacteriales bacterium]|jgi:hypothetical protein
MLVYCDKPSVRLKHVLDFIFNEFYDTNYTLISNIPEIESNDQFFINYSHENHSNCLSISPEGLLSEDFLRTQKEYFTDEQVLFEQKSLFGFDLFSAVFYLISRYEEYLAFTPDKIGRFSSKESMLFEDNMKLVPIIDIWLLNFESLLKEKNPSFDPSKRKFNVKATIDVDKVYAYKEAGVFRSLGASMRDFIANPPNLNHRISVLTGTKPDPFFVFDKIEKIHKKHKLKATYFIHFGEKKLPYDDISGQNSNALNYWLSQNKDKSFGLHPSFKSNTETEIIKEEKSLLEKAIGKKVNHSRQHYLKLSFPQTYNELIEAGITNDHSLGFADSPGFRAGTTHSFKFFNLETNESTELTVHPFSLMDTTLRAYQKLNPEEALFFSKSLIDSIKKVDGTFCCLFHNESLSNWGPWKGWQNLYEDVLDYCYS